MNRKERVLTASNHKVQDRIPIDFGCFPGDTFMNVRAYEDLLEYMGIKKHPRYVFPYRPYISKDIYYPNFFINFFSA